MFAAAGWVKTNDDEQLEVRWAPADHKSSAALGFELACLPEKQKNGVWSYFLINKLMDATCVLINIK